MFLVFNIYTKHYNLINLIQQILPLLVSNINPKIYDIYGSLLHFQCRGQVEGGKKPKLIQENWEWEFLIPLFGTMLLGWTWESCFPRHICLSWSALVLWLSRSYGKWPFMLSNSLICLWCINQLSKVNNSWESLSALLMRFSFSPPSGNFGCHTTAKFMNSRKFREESEKWVIKSLFHLFW